MKKLNVLAIISIFISSLLFVSCNNKYTPTSSVSVVTQSSYSQINANSEATPQVISVEIRENSIDISSMQEIKATALRYVETLGIRKRYENALPSLIFFEYPYIYFDQFFSMIEGTGESEKDLFIGRYSLEKKEREKIDEADFMAMSSEASMLMENKYLFYMICNSDSDGQPVMDIIMYDLDNKITKTICKQPTTNLYGYVRQINSNEVVFFLYNRTITEKLPKQALLKYNIKEDEMATIFQGDKMNWNSETDSTKNIWAIDTYKEEIYLILHQLINGDMKTFLQVLELDGSIKETYELPIEERYNSKYLSIDNLVVEDGYIFLHYDQFVDDEFRLGKPPSVIYKKTDSTFVRVDIGNVFHKSQLNQKAIEDRYIYFSTYTDEILNSPNRHISNRLLVFDTLQETATIIDLEITNIETITCDSSGNLAVSTRISEDEESHWYFIDKMNCQVKCASSRRKTRIGDFQPKHLRGLELIRNRLLVSSS